MSNHGWVYWNRRVPRSSWTMHSISLQRKFKRRRQIVTRIEVSKEKKSKLTKKKCNFTYLDSVMPYLQLNLNLLNKLGFTVRGMFFYWNVKTNTHIYLIAGISQSLPNSGNSLLRNKRLSTPSLVITAILKNVNRENSVKSHGKIDLNDLLPHTSSTCAISRDCKGDTLFCQFDTFLFVHAFFVVSVQETVQIGTARSSNWGWLPHQSSTNRNLNVENGKIRSSFIDMSKSLFPGNIGENIARVNTVISKMCVIRKNCLSLSWLKFR